MTDITFNDTELQVIKRVLGFATVNIPVEDGVGGSIYPTVETQRIAQDLINRLNERGVQDAVGLYVAFDPVSELSDKTILIWQDRPDGYTYQIRGKVTSVDGSDTEGWSVTLGEIVMGPFSREELKRSCQVELDIP